MRAGVSQGEVAQACGVTAATVSRWESNTRRPRGSAGERYALLLQRLVDLAP
jgi:DNA-binding transcriptional regulator YiaG